jgi:hypothetical protein
VSQQLEANGRHGVPGHEYEAKYRAYMLNAAAAFPYSVLGMSQAVAAYQSQFQALSNPLLTNLSSRQLFDNLPGFFSPIQHHYHTQQQQQHQRQSQQHTAADSYQQTLNTDNCYRRAG